MSCKICNGVGVIDCDFCRKNLDVLLSCFSNEEEVYHFCSHTCFENYLLEINDKNFKQTGDMK